METSCLAHPPKDPLVIIRQWQLEFCEGDYCAAVIIGMFELIYRKVIPSDLFLTAEKIRNNILHLYSISIIKESLLYLAKRELLYITTYRPQEAQKMLLANKKPQLLDITTLPQCSWCKCRTFILHSHHYPIPKIKGGIEKINICANCHNEHHFLTDNIFYAPKPKLADEFKKHPFSESEKQELWKQLEYNNE